MPITSQQQIQVLHVDDNPETTELTATFLERGDDRFSVETATSANEGLQLLDESEIDCIVSDYQMPGMNGIEFLERVAENHPNLPFILYTGKGSEEVASEAISAGVTDYLQKESGTDDYALLANRIIHAVNSHHRERRIQFLQTLETELSELSIDFLRTKERDIDSLIDRTLEKLGTLVEADRTYVFDIDHEAETLSNTHEWSSGGVEPQIDMLQDIPQDTLPWWIQKLKNFENIIIDSVSELPPEAQAEQEILQEQNIQSLIVTPMISNDELVGFIGFDWVEQQEAWSDEFINILRMTSELITTARKREKREQDIKESKERIAEQNDALESFTEIVTDAERTPTQKITQLLELGATYLTLDIGILSYVEGPEYTVRNVVDPTGAIEPGNSFNFADTYCSLVYEADGPVSFHSPVDGGVKDHPAYQKQETESYIGAPVRVNGQRYGTLNFSQPESRSNSFTDAEESFVLILAQWMGTELERQQREEELERASTFLRETQEVAQVGGWEFDLQTETLRWSDEVYHIHGLALDANPTPEQGIEFYHPDDRDTMRKAFDHLTTDGEPYDLELRIIRADNDDVRWVRTRGEPVYKDDKIVAVHGTFQDITEHKQRERQIAETNTVLRTIVENLPFGILVEDSDRNVLMANERLTEVLGVPIASDDLIGVDCDLAAKDMQDLFADPEEFIPEINERLARRELVQNEELPLADGRVIERDFIPYTLPDGEASMWLYRNVTERKQREQELERGRQIIQHSTDIATIIAPDGTITYVSPNVERVLGYKPTELIGNNGFEYQPPETKEAVADAIEHTLEHPDETQTVQTRFRRADESLCWIESTLRNHTEEELIDGILVSSRDITDRKEYEQRIEEQRDNLKTVNQVVRHDIRNDLQLVTAYADLLAGHIEERSDSHEYIEKIQDSAGHAVELTRTARELTDVMLTSEANQEQIPLQNLLTTELDEAQAAYSEGSITIEGEIPTVDVLADEMLGSVFRNLLTNAVQHNDKSVPEVTVAVEDRTDTVRVCVADNGRGVPDEQKEDIFGKGEKGLNSKGTGIGLHLVQTLVESYGGDVWVTDNDPEGAIFIVQLPVAT